MIAIDKPPAWMDRGLCANSPNPEDWFPFKVSDRIAESACDGCEVQALCLQWALDHGIEDGTWGGVSERRRRKMARQMRRERREAPLLELGVRPTSVRPCTNCGHPSVAHATKHSNPAKYAQVRARYSDGRCDRCHRAKRGNA